MTFADLADRHRHPYGALELSRSISPEHMIFKWLLRQLGRWKEDTCWTLMGGGGQGRTSRRGLLLRGPEEALPDRLYTVFKDH